MNRKPLPLARRGFGRGRISQLKSKYYAVKRYGSGISNYGLSR
jgi:hypothetical protein